MKENKANKKGRKLLWGTVIITMILSFMFFYVLYCSNNKYMTRMAPMRAFLSIICPENGNIIRMHFLRRRMIWINIIFVIFLLGNMVEWNLETVGEVRMGVVHTG